MSGGARLGRAIRSALAACGLALVAARAVSAAPLPPSAPRPAASAPHAVRTLDEITIEGEIPLPQVLFIAENDVPRYADLAHRRFVMTALDVGRTITLPSRVAIPAALFLHTASGTLTPREGPDE